MSRYQIGVGNEFPMDEDRPNSGPLPRGCSWGHHWEARRWDGGARWEAPWAGGRGERWVGRFGLATGPMILRGVFLLSLIVVAVTHAVAVVLVLGAFLVARHSPWAHEARARWRRTSRERWHGRADDGAFV